LTCVAQNQQTNPTTRSGNRAHSLQLPKFKGKPASKPPANIASQDPFPKPKPVSKNQKGAVRKMVILPLPSQSSDKLAEESQGETEESLEEEEEDLDLVAAQGLADFSIEVY
jgi:hypothetical protein